MATENGESTELEVLEEKEDRGFHVDLQTFVRVKVKTKDKKTGAETEVFKAQTETAFNKAVAEHALAVQKGEATEENAPQSFGMVTVKRYNITSLEGLLALCEGNEEIAVSKAQRGWEIDETEVYRNLVESGAELPEGEYDLRPEVAKPKERRKSDPMSKISKNLSDAGLDADLVAEAMKIIAALKSGGVAAAIAAASAT